MTDESFLYGMDPGEIAVTTTNPAYTGTLHFHLQYIGEQTGVCFLPLSGLARQEIKDGNYLCITEVILKLAKGEGETDFASGEDIKRLEYGSDKNRKVKKIAREQLMQLKQGVDLRDAADWYVLTEDETIRIFSGSYQIARRGEEFTFYIHNISSHAKKGITELSVQVGFEDNQVGDAVKISLQKVEKHPRIVSFYAEKGAVCPGERVKLKWVIENTATAELVFPDGTIQSINTQEQAEEEVQVTAAADYTLRVTGESKTLRIETAPLFLEKFFVDYENAKLVWRAAGAKNQKISIANKLYDECGSLDLNLFADETVCLSAQSDRRKLTSILYKYAQRKKQVPHFQKTLFDFGEYQLLRVEWRTDGMASVRLLYQDYERGEIVEIMTEGKKSGQWEQLVFGTYIKITMEAQEFQNDALYRITI